MAWLLCVVLAQALSACGPKPQVMGSGGQHVPDNKVITINTSFCANPDHMHVSMSAHDEYQWHNVSGTTVLVIFDGAASGETIADKEWSSVQKVCAACTAGQYPYKIYKVVNGVPTSPGTTCGGPNPPEVDVDN
jgi:hypothetical protein